MTADRDDLAAILAKHRYDHPRLMEGGHWFVVCSCGDSIPAPIDKGNDHDHHRAHVAQMVLESDWLRDVKADVWKEARMAVLSGFVPESEHEFLSLYPNPYRADRVDAEDGGR